MEQAGSQGKRTRIDRRVLLVMAVAVLAIAGAASLALSTAQPPGTTETTTISAGADKIVASAVQAGPAGFTLESSKQPPSGTADWAVLQQADGSEANLTVTVYSSTGAAQAHFDRFVAGVRDLPGYTEVTSSLASFEQYGGCYGYGEDVVGIAVIYGVCTKGIVFLQAHLVSSIDFSTLEGDLTSSMGALYQGAA